MKKYSIGTHILLNLFDCEESLLDDAKKVEEILNKAVKESGLTKVGQSFHQFQPRGVTGVLLLSESHICIHTWPEFNMAAIDVFSCSDEKYAQLAADILIQQFHAKRVDKQVCYR